MASEVTIPRLGWNMDEGTFVGWLKSDGQHVAAGEPLFSLEGDKATQDVESLETGILRIPPDAPKEGEKVTVGALVGYLVAPGEPAPFEVVSARNSSNTLAHSQEGEPAGELNPNAVWTELGPPKIANSELAPGTSKRRMSPRARRVARELGVGTIGLEGSGTTGRILERDVRAAARAQTAPACPPAFGPERGAGVPPERPSPEYREIAVTPVRKKIAERLLQSAQTTAAVTLSTSVDATNLVNLRQQFKAVAGAGVAPSIGFTDIVVKLTAVALEKHPLLNARWSGDEILVSSNIHIGIAVDTDAGLLVPVIHDVPRQTLRQLAMKSRDLIDRARRGALAASEMQGGTFTVTNLGPMDVEMFTPLINVPESAILGLGRIQKQVVVDDKQFVARDRMMLSLTFDHRIVDGAPAARFLQSLGLLIENPSPWLMP
jgi:pyruvate dehydrogenase E2 component (dihydrolipoamide acetyltransferase)